MSTGSPRVYVPIGPRAVHTLDPVELGQASVLEEGAATYFQHWYVPERLPFQDDRRLQWSTSEDPRYRPAHDLVGSLLKREPLALRRLRQAGHTLSLAAPEALMALVPSLARPIAEELVQRFEEWSRIRGPI